MPIQMSREVNNQEIAFGSNNSNSGNNNRNYGNNNSNCGNSNSFNNINIKYNKKQPVLEQLSAQASRERHLNVSDKRVEGVGDWLLCGQEFSMWRASEDQTAKPVLFYSGNPGVGKTFIRYESPNANLVLG